MIPSSGVPVSPITGVPGWLSDSEEAELIRLAGLVGTGGVIVEIGAEYGRSAAALCSGAAPSVTIISIDLFPTDHPVVGDLMAAYKSNLKSAGFADRTFVVKGNSRQIGRGWKLGGRIDLLFIDGDHSYRGARADLQIWAKFVGCGGYLACHDCEIPDKDSNHDLHIEVAQAIRQWRDPEAWPYVGQVETLYVLQRGGKGVPKVGKRSSPSHAAYQHEQAYK
jgi:predicted O-methyltransferase YrrM